MNDRVLLRLKDKTTARKIRWDDLGDREWLDLEDSYMELFRNAYGKDVYMHSDLVSDPDS